MLIYGVHILIIELIHVYRGWWGFFFIPFTLHQSVIVHLYFIQSLSLEKVCDSLLLQRLVTTFLHKLLQSGDQLEFVVCGFSSAVQKVFQQVQ